MLSHFQNSGFFGKASVYLYLIEKKKKNLVQKPRFSLQGNGGLPVMAALCAGAVLMPYVRRGN
jgi:hypothetical protein